MNRGHDPHASIEFGQFTVLPHRRELLLNGAPIELGGRAFDVLMALIEARGMLLSRDELMSRVWPGRIVEENNLQVQIAALRKALGADRDLVRTVAGRGYQFTGELRAASVTAPAAASSRATNLATSVSELIGRDALLREVTDLVRAHRLVTLTGAGGIGKTRLGLEVGWALLPAFAGGVWIAELGPLSDPELVPVTVATALGLTLAAGAPSPERVAAALGTRQVLVVLDNCEHLIEAAARMAEALLRASPVACVMATSREPLRTAGEFVYRVPALDVPPEGTQTTEDLLRSGAVRLFVARSRAADPHFAADGRIAAVIAAICRQLDGIPLAIELAAARTAALGVEGLAARLDDRFRLLTGGHRTALPRHQTLRATLDWSHELLPEPERVVLRRLAVFAGGITLESASAVAAQADISPADVVDSVVNLVAKSLLTAVGSAIAQYRLLETTRAYALEKLGESGELAPVARRHAEYYRDVFERAATEWETQPTAEWLAAYSRQIANVRAALDWVFTPDGDSRIGVALTVAAVPLWMHLSLMEECRGRVECALASLGPESGRFTREGMQLYAGLGLSLMYTKGAVPETRAALARALEIAESLQDTDYQLRALWGLCVDRLNNGMFREALAFAERFCSVAASSADPVDLPIGDRMMGLSLHYLGDQTNARRHFERMLSRYVAPVRRAHSIRFQFDQRVTAHIALAEVLWIQGYPEQAMRAVESNIEEAAALHHTLSLCNALAKACPVALLAGDLAAAERFITLLLDHSTRHALASWQAEGRCFQGVLLVKRGELGEGLQLLRSALEDLPGINFSLRYTALLGELADALGRTGEVAQGLIAIDRALERSDRNEERWCVAELCRIKGDLVLSEGGQSAAAAAEGHFRKGLDWASRQSALSWELRCATGLARSWQGRGMTGQAREVLAPVYARFTEGFETADLKTAKALLDAVR
ncbi:MAG TPA: winged helix-turn-helix domain-containing protein [Burkholderiales bacterium]|nr:winged helix-turn-helix domain-containing protein [Burkholderiales bacterium]